MIHNPLRSLLLSHNRLLISSDCYQEAMFQCLPIGTLETKPLSFYKELPTYSEKCAKILSELKSENDISVVYGDYTSPDIQDNSIAYYPIFGIILSDYPYSWYFSTKRFEREIIEAESNPNIICHFIHINSGGGDAWYMDRVSETLRNLKKPIIVLAEQCMGSAAYYIGCHGKKIFALTNNDLIGSIGCMVSFMDFSGYYDKLGIKLIEEYADQSDLKNQKIKKLIAGKSDDYKKDILNPLAQQFIDEVVLCRNISTENNNPVLRGEVYFSNDAIQHGLVDEIASFNDALNYANQIGLEYKDKINTRTKIASMF